MPRLPQTVQNQPLSASGLSISSSMQPGEAAASLGRDVANIGTEMTQRIINIQRANQVMTKSAQGAEAAAKLYDQIKNDPSVPDAELAQRVQEGFKILHDNIGADIKDRQVREIFDNNFQGLTTAHVVDAVSEGRRRIISAANAGRAESNDTNVNLAVTYPGGPIHDKAIADLMANTDSAVANKMITAEEGQKEKSLNLDKIEVGGVLRQIREDPSTAFADLQDPQKYTNLDAVMRQRLTTDAWNMVQANAQQALTNMRANEAEAAKIRHEGISSDVTNMRLLASEGKLTHQGLADAVQKWRPTKPGEESFPGPEVSVLTDLINKPFESPSDQATRDWAELAVTASRPTATVDQLQNLRSRGFLNTQDYLRYEGMLTTNLHYLEDQAKEAMRSREVIAEDIIRNRYGGAPLVFEQALKDLADSSAARAGTKDPLSLLEPLQKKYDPMLLEVGGPTVAKVRQEFVSAQNALENAQKSLGNWKSVHYNRAFFGGTNQAIEDDIRIKKETLVDRAKKAKRLIGPADPGTKEDATWPRPDGSTAVVVNGQVIIKE